MIPRPSPQAFAAALLWSAVALGPASARPPEAAPAAAAATPSPEPGIVYRSDESDDTAKGLASQPQFSGCGVVYNGPKSELGTGTAIAPNWVLTAKHVVTGYTTATFQAGNGQTITGTVTLDSATDMALIKLDSNLVTTSGQSYTPVALITPNLPGALVPTGPKVQPVGPLIWNVGYGNYGQYGGTVNNLDLKRRGGTNVVNSYGNSLLNFSNENTAGTEFECSTGPGDSGGPMYLQTGYQWRIAAEVYGVTSNGFSDTDVSFNNFLSTTTGISFAPQAAPTSLTWNFAYLSPSTTASKNITNFVDGPGNWNTTRLNFVGATTGGDSYTYAWQNATLLPVTFGRGSGTAGTVTVTTPINVSDLTFATTGGGSYNIAGSGTNGLTLAAAGSSVTVNSGVAPLISAPLFGTGALTKLGPGGLTLSGANTYTGGTNINVGGVLIGVQAALGTSGNILVASGATLTADSLGQTGYTLASGRMLTDNGTITGALSVSGTLTGTGVVGATSSSYPLTVNSGGQILGAAGTLTVRGTSITNNGTITMPSGATLDASAVGSLFNGGTLNVAGNAKLPQNVVNNSGGTITNSGGTLAITSQITNNGTIRVTGGAVFDASAASSFNNNGVLDLIDGSARLPGSYYGSGTILTSDLLRIKSTTRAGTSVVLTVDSYTGHNYQLQRGTTPDGTSFANLGNAQAGSTGAALTFTDASPPATQGFYRVVLVP